MPSRLCDVTEICLIIHENINFFHRQVNEWLIYFSVDEKERENGRDPEKECMEDGFHDYQRPYVQNYKLVHGPWRDMLASQLGCGTD